MAQFFNKELCIRLVHLNRRVEESRAFLQTRNFDNHQEIELQARHLSNNLKRVQAMLQQATGDNVDAATYTTASEKLIEADDILLELNMFLQTQPNATCRLLQ